LYKMFTVALVLLLSGVHTSQDVAQTPVTLANRWRLTPVGRHVALLGDMPGSILPLPDGKRCLVNTCGYHNHSLSLIDLSQAQVVAQTDLGQDWVGMALDGNGTAYVSGGSAKAHKGKRGASGSPALGVRKFNVEGDALVDHGGFLLPGGGDSIPFTSGLSFAPDGTLVALDIQSDAVYKLDPATGAQLAKAAVGYRPYAATISPDGKTLAVSNWGDGTVSLLSPNDLSLQAIVKTGSRPNAMAFARDGRLFVANSGDNTVAVILQGRVIERIRTAFDVRDPIGATPDAVAVSKNGTRLYVANADNNDVAVVDVSQARRSQILGFIPTGRYPSALALTEDGKGLLVGTGKGMGTQDSPNVGATTGLLRTKNGAVAYEYIGDKLAGYLTLVTVPDDKTLARYTAMAISDRPNDHEDDLSSQDRAARIAALRRIHHVIYVIKENRTYDQVLGDDVRGNGDNNLVFFGKDITPNIHNLADTYTLLDNLYCDGECSQVGHQWTDAAYAGDYTQKQWVLSYSDRQEVVSDPRLTSSPGLYIWEDAKKHGKTARIFGEYVEWQEDHSSAQGDVKKDPEKYGCSAGFEKIFARGGRDTEKVDEFLGEMKAAEKTGKWPNFMVMALNEDHTRGMSAGAYTPQAMVASNDLAVGRLIDGVSHSPFWKDSAIFVIEDDAQDGPDHVDTHRTEGLFVSPYVKRGTVDHTHYSTSSMIHTMEVILGLPPLSQYDQAALPMLASVTTTPDFTPYDVLPETYDLTKRNPARTRLAALSAKLDFSADDLNDPDLFNAILWEGLKPGSPMPAPVHGLLRP
jgi:YVTN family beta-propeller protein